MALRKKGAKRQKRSDDLNAEEYVEPEKLRLRNTYGTKINDCLLKGLDEVKGDDPNFSMTEDDVRKLTNAICDTCHDYYSYDKRGFKQKMFDIYSNLKRENNCDLRRKIITKGMSVTQLIHADTRELAPYDLQRKRQMELEKHYLRNVILPGEATGQADSQHAHMLSLTPTNIVADNPADTNETTSPNRSSEAGSARSLDTMSDGFLFSNDASSESQSETGEEESGSRGSIEYNGDAEQSQKEGSEAVRSPALGNSDDASVEENQPHNDSEPSKNTDTSPGGLSFLSQHRKSTSEENDSARMPVPPDGSRFTLDRVFARLEERLEKLPAYISKPFRGPLKCGHKRISLIMARSPILHQTMTQDKKRQI
ncbi:hypothetical protein X943_000343 [Babesia divergens]|uniref:TFIIS central domain-containing protein n=1 Tax=Babesia divergens TaxID=32595 RepID=A0AAD9GKL1_BABDI|nr:hypothetical protein X943_000343 [Babesia divergens]